MDTDALPVAVAEDLVARGPRIGEAVGRDHCLLALGAVGIWHTTVSAALAAALLGARWSGDVRVPCLSFSRS